MFRCEGFLGHHAERVKQHAIMATTPQTLRKRDQSGDGRSSEEHALLLRNRPKRVLQRSSVGRAVLIRVPPEDACTR